MKNSFDAIDKDEFIARLNNINANTSAKWGKMNAGQMCAHVCVAYEMAIDGKGEKATGLKRWFLKKLVKNIVVGEKPYKKNNRTTPEFLIQGDKDFDKERKRLIAYINQTHDLGEAHFDGKESNSFGALTKGEWNNLFSKHLDHHLNQFGV